MAFLFLTLWIFTFYEKIKGAGSISELFIYIVFGLGIVGIIFFLWKHEWNRIDKYFRENFKNIIDRRELEIKKTNNKK